ncbi:hypothetical protein BU17DRAFT_83047 [Hysterangium stoloniferum]|nr:hypothetical protein BU17DRAFT_83047 [Hysterangium stoloniferum]
MLNSFGKLAIVEIIAYIPVICFSFFVVLRHGFSRKVGWILLFLFAIVRTTGAVLTIITQEDSNPSTTLLTVTAILQGLGLSPLLMSTLAFVSRIVSHGLPSFTKFMRLLHLLLSVAVILVVVGGTKQAPDNSVSDQNSGHKFSKIGSICFLVGYLAISGLIVLLWGAKEKIPYNHRKLLLSLTIVLPFLAVRVTYSVISVFSTSTPEHPSQWSPTAGNWKIYLFMGLIAEYIICSIYVISGMLIPLEDEKSSYEQENGGSLFEMGRKRIRYTRTPV